MTSSLDLWYNRCGEFASRIPILTARVAVFSFLGGASGRQNTLAVDGLRGDAAHPYGAAMIPAEVAVALDDYEERMRRFWSEVCFPFRQEDHITVGEVWDYLLGEVRTPEENLFCTILANGWDDREKYGDAAAQKFCDGESAVFFRVLGIDPVQGRGWLDYCHSEANMAKAKKGKGGKGKKGC